MTFFLLFCPVVGGWPEAQNIDRISRIEVSHGDVVDGIRISYQLKTGEIVTKTHCVEWRLAGVDIASSEVFNEVRGRHGDAFDGWGIHIQELEFVLFLNPLVCALGYRTLCST
ncbi:hypothetical protein BJV78DRAFT_1204081 [Lactifluus subvellereus]|nr:hypothetical protein BJV78DRAFT_1204081 [Lactifluus subvellereus]